MNHLCCHNEDQKRNKGVFEEFFKAPPDDAGEEVEQITRTHTSSRARTNPLLGQRRCLSSTIPLFKGFIWSTGHRRGRMQRLMVFVGFSRIVVGLHGPFFIHRHQIIVCLVCNWRIVTIQILGN